MSQLAPRGMAQLCFVRAAYARPATQQGSGQRPGPRLARNPCIPEPSQNPCRTLAELSRNPPQTAAHPRNPKNRRKTGTHAEACGTLPQSRPHQPGSLSGLSPEEYETDKLDDILLLLKLLQVPSTHSNEPSFPKLTKEITSNQC